MKPITNAGELKSALQNVSDDTPVTLSGQSAAEKFGLNIDTTTEGSVQLSAGDPLDTEESNSGDQSGQGGNRPASAAAEVEEEE
jgi:hypothetical protein